VSKLWNIFTEYLNKEFNMDEYLAYKIASFDILKMSAMGYSNSRISYRLCVHPKNIQNTLINLLHFTGWETDLDFSPLAIFNRCKTFNEYEKEIIVISPVSKKIVIMSYNIVFQYVIIKKEINRYYAN
jgi:hypothetical protein